MRNFLALMLLTSIYSWSAFCETYTYRVAESCAQGFTVKITVWQTPRIVSREKGVPIIYCRDYTKSEENCIGPYEYAKQYSYRVRVGTVEYANSLGKVYRGPLTVEMWGEVLTGSQLNKETIQYRFNTRLGAGLRIGDFSQDFFGAISDFEGRLKNMPNDKSFAKAGATFTGLSEFYNQWFGRFNEVPVILEGAPGIRCPDGLLSAQRI